MFAGTWPARSFETSIEKSGGFDHDHGGGAAIGMALSKETPHREFNVTQTYSLFIAILCW